ncbi:MAG: hypothetical protein Q7K28_03715, partial [Candidatus Wildermuthbacteria bacterium]|nr:hypothetical protein [Candidatus Wildermuthbacteria bacterium]
KIITENLIGKIIYEGMLTDRTGIFFRKYKDDFSMLGTQTLIALKIYTMENGKLPNSLTDLVPKYISEIPEDAFDGNPLRFSSTKKIIYSVGGDLKDSGGSEGDDWGKMEDPTFKIEF